MLMFTNNESCIAFECKTGKQTRIPARCYVYIMSSNETEYKVQKLCLGNEMLEVAKGEFNRKFIKC